MATATTGRTGRTATRKPAKPTTPAPVVEAPTVAYRPGKGARFTFSVPALEEIRARLAEVNDLLAPEFTASATHLEIGAKLNSNGFALSATGDDRYGFTYESEPITLADKTQLRISVVVTKSKSLKIDFRTWFAE